MFCPNCGKQIPDDSVFCPLCGKRLDEIILQYINQRRPFENQDELTKIRNEAFRIAKSGNPLDAKPLFLKGAQMGDPGCMIGYVSCLKMEAHASYKIDPSFYNDSIEKLLVAEQWANKAKESGYNDAERTLTGKYGVYSELAWCYLISATKGNNADYYKVIEYFEKIVEEPASNTRWAYMRALSKIGDKKREFEQARELFQKHDDTLEPYMQEIVNYTLSLAYYDGEVTEPDYNLAYKHAEECYRLNPEQNKEFFDLFLNGKMKKEFDAKFAGSHRDQSQSKPDNDGGKNSKKETLASAIVLIGILGIIVLVVAFQAFSANNAKKKEREALKGTWRITETMYRDLDGNVYYNNTYFSFLPLQNTSLEFGDKCTVYNGNSVDIYDYSVGDGGITIMSNTDRGNVMFSYDLDDDGVLTFSATTRMAVGGGSDELEITLRRMAE